MKQVVGITGRKAPMMPSVKNPQPAPIQSGLRTEINHVSCQPAGAISYCAGKGDRATLLPGKSVLPPASDPWKSY